MYIYDFGHLFAIRLNSGKGWQTCENAL